jgi:hypothetical protein
MTKENIPETHETWTAPPLSEAPGWASVEDAPKVNNRRVIGWCYEWSDCFIVKWSPNRPAPHWTTDDGAVTSYAPTHWQPLPAFPVLPNASGEPMPVAGESTSQIR